MRVNMVRVKLERDHTRFSFGRRGKRGLRRTRQDVVVLAGTEGSSEARTAVHERVGPIEADRG